MSEAKVIRCRAAVAWSKGEPMVIETIDVDPPKSGEVRVKIASTGICSSDVSGLSGKAFNLTFPVIFGHEAAGIVESVGEKVSDFQIGDHVIPIFLPQCKQCRICKDAHANVCMEFFGALSKGHMLDGTSRFSCRGVKISNFYGCSTFTEFSVINVINLAKINPAAPLSEVCLLSCGFATGYGAALKTANVKTGSTCAIFGLGTLGLATALGCKTAGASTIIGIDINPDKEKISKDLGVTRFINPSEVGTPIEEYLATNFDPIDFSFECVGKALTIKQAYDSLAIGNGVCVLIGIAERDCEISISPVTTILGKTLKGSLFGSYKSVDDVPKLVEEYLAGKLQLDKFITHTMPLDKINEGFELLKEGKSIRTIIHFD